MSQVRECQGCRYAGHCYEGSGAVPATLLIVNDWLYKEDVSNKVIGAGPLADMQRKAFGGLCGVKDLFFTCAVKGETRGVAPEAREINACRAWLEHEIARVQPKLIVACGRAALASLSNGALDFVDMRGRLWVEPFTGWKIFTTYAIGYVDKYSSFTPDKSRTRECKTGSVPWFYRKDLLELRRILEEGGL